MSEKTFLRDGYASVYHRIAGNAPMSDLDIADAPEGFSENLWTEYAYREGEIEVVSFIDYKKAVKNGGRTPKGQIGVYRYVASKCNVPLFIVLCFLDTDYPVKMYYVMPANDLARAFFTKWELDWSGKWMTLLQFSFFRYKLRGKKWYRDYQIKDEDVEAILALDPSAPIRKGMRLRDLPNTAAFYKLPPLQENE